MAPPFHAAIAGLLLATGASLRTQIENATVYIIRSQQVPSEEAFTARIAVALKATT